MQSFSNLGFLALIGILINVIETDARTSTSRGSGRRIAGGAIAGIAIAALVLILLCCLCAFCLFRRRRSPRGPVGGPEAGMAPVGTGAGYGYGPGPGAGKSGRFGGMFGGKNTAAGPEVAQTGPAFPPPAYEGGYGNTSGAPYGRNY